MLNFIKLPTYKFPCHRFSLEPKLDFDYVSYKDGQLLQEADNEKDDYDNVENNDNDGKGEEAADDNDEDDESEGDESEDDEGKQIEFWQTPDFIDYF